MRERLAARYPDDVGLLNQAPASERLRADRTPLGAALRLFFLEEDEPAAGLNRLLPAGLVRELVAARLLARRGRALRARLRVDAYADLMLLADRRFQRPDLGGLGLPRGDMVYPPSSDSILLAEAVSARDGERVLDLCTGSGIQGLAVAARAASVVAVDIGRRAAAMARANAALNQRALEVREGDLYRPVRGERFDLIIANPPFVPARTRGPAYHSGGPRGDRVLRRVVEGWAAHLRDGGRALAISHLALRRGETVADAVRPWARDFAGRVVALVLESGGPIDLAAAQALFALDDGFAGYAREVRDWTGYLQRQRIEQIVLLLLAAERGGAARLDVVEAYQRVLPIPLSHPPATVLREQMGW
ncbi:MAG: methyltransferase [Deltaproteobacteria bacterium]|nr:methyltransferase [Deltaproteobacteria bacterium]